MGMIQTPPTMLTTTPTAAIDITNMDRLRPWISKIVAAPVAMGCMAISNKMGWTYVGDIQTQATIVAGLTWFLSEVVHVLVSKYVNPANTASAHLAVQGVQDHNSATGI